MVDTFKISLSIICWTSFSSPPKMTSRIPSKMTSRIEVSFSSSPILLAFQINKSESNKKMGQSEEKKTEKKKNRKKKQSSLRVLGRLLSYHLLDALLEKCFGALKKHVDKLFFQIPNCLLPCRFKLFLVFLFGNSLFPRLRVLRVADLVDLSKRT